MSANDANVVEFDITYGVTRHINCLQDQNRHTRRRALEAIRNEISSAQTNNVCELAIRPLLRACSDPVEKCRELAILTVTELFGLTSEPCSLLQCVVPTLAQRLAQPEIPESSEELRLQLVKLTRSTVDRCSVHVAPYLNDLVSYVIIHG